MIVRALLFALALAEGTPAATEEEEQASRRCAELLDDSNAPFASRRLWALDRLRDWVPPGTVEACVDRLLEARGVPRGLQRAAQALRATWAWKVADDERAAALATAAGAIDGWEAAGPFTHPQRSPLAGGGTIEEAVAALRAGETGPLSGRYGPVDFRPLPAPRSDGAIDVARAVPLDDGSCALLRASVKASGGRAALLLGGAPALSVWLPAGDGRPVVEPLEVPAVRDGTASERAAAELPAGAGPWTVLVGVCPEGDSAEVRAFADRAPARADVEVAAEAIVREARRARDADALLAAAELLVESGALPGSADPLADLPSRLPAEAVAEAELLRARSGASAAERFAAAGRALVLRPDDPEVLLAVVREGAALPGRPDVAAAILRLAERPVPSLRAAAAFARERIAAHLPLAAHLLLAPFDAAGQPVAAQRALIDTLLAMGSPARTVDAAERLVALAPRDASAWAALFEAWIAAGSYDAVRERLAGAPFAAGEGEPGTNPLPSLALERLAANTLLRLGDVEAALVRLRRLAAERPSDEDAWFELGWALVRAGREEEAERSLRAGLAVRPSDARARSWIAAREPADPEVERRLGDEAETAAALERIAVAFPDAGLAFALRAVVVTLDASGAVRERHRRVLLARTAAGAAGLASLPLASFDPTRTVFRLLRSAVHGADGRSRGGASLALEGSDAPDVRLYSPMRLASVSLPALDAGDVVEVEFELIEIGPSSLPEGALAREVAVREAWPTALLRVAGAVPDGVALRVDAPADVDGRSAQEVVGGRRFASWEARDVPAVAAEPLGPPLREASGAVRLTTFTSWDEVGQWLARLFRLRTGDSRVAALAEGKDLAGIYREVSANVRYVAAEYGSHGLEPAPPAATLARGYGDCKDKVALLDAALAAAGIAAVPVLVRSRFAGADPSGGAFPFPYAFDHVIAYLPPPIDRFVDPTSTRLPWDVLPRADRGAAALVLEPAGPRWATLPSDAPEGEGIERNDILLFDPTGEAALLGEVSASGADAGDLRELMAAPDIRAGILAVLFGRDLPDVRIIAVDLDGLDPGASRVRAGYVGSVPGFTRATREGLEAPLGVRFDLVGRFAPLETRSTDLELSAAGFPVRWRRDVKIGLSGNWEWTDVPPDVHESSAFGDFSFSTRLDEGMLHVAVELRLPLLRVPAADYATFRNFLARVDAVLEWTAMATRPEPGE